MKKVVLVLLGFYFSLQIVIAQTGLNITYYGTGALGNGKPSSSTGDNNSAFGYRSMYSNTTGARNVALGSLAMNANSTGYDNVAVGHNCMQKNTTGYSNTAVGSNALSLNTTGGANTAFGYYCLSTNTTGSGNLAMGIYAMRANSTGSWNTAIGYNTLFANSTGYQNTAYGYMASSSNTTGNSNTGLGMYALTANTTGSNNTAIGYNAGANIQSGTNNILIGYGCTPSANIISNEVTLGNISNNAYRMYASGWINASDARLKHNIENIPVGLKFINTLHPVEYVYNNAQNEEKSMGFIAQEVLESVKKSNMQNSSLVVPIGDDKLGLKTTDLIPVLTKAVQELSAENDALKERLTKIEAMLNTSTNVAVSDEKTSKTEITLSSAKLEQNVPNPFNTGTIVKYFIPSNARSSVISITKENGEPIKTVNISSKGAGQITINTATLSAGSYNYSLIIDGVVIDSRKMILSR